ncbi:cation diffusion facilitator family transporter [Arcticibacter tournemirensis]|uniref:Cation transporter n=1 Tax=Arcticibacter tournemirensis TaxID=699437 RepID=A0A4Q0MA15_9SPHI|nr:cation diffusion facilitator family transporter [Arcticibacter tournemirensis]RXF69639.1 cation transporter [Arcticibacter tournemirensis]
MAESHCEHGHHHEKNENHHHEHGGHHHDEHDHHHHDGQMHMHPVVKNLRVAFIINLSFSIIEFIGGALTNSVAILSDAVHDLGDAVVIGISLWMEKFSQKGRSMNYSYGYKRFSTLAAFITSVVLLVGSAIIIFESVPRFFHPEEVHAGGMFALAIVGIIFNGLAILRLRKGDSLNQRAVMLHMMEDVLGWIAVLIGSVVIYYTEWYWIDPLMSLGIAAFILVNATKNIFGVFRIFLQSVPQQVDEHRIISRLTGIDQVKGVHDIHIWSMDGNYNVLTAHIVVDKHARVDELNEIKNQAVQILKEQNIQHPTVQIEFQSGACEFERC